MAEPKGVGPGPYQAVRLRTTFLRVPAQDWNAVEQGHKTEFRTSGYHSTNLLGVRCPIPAVAYRVLPGKIYDSTLVVLESIWTEPLAAMSEESLRREGHETFAHFRRYWMARTGKRFTPLTKVQVHRLRPFKSEDRPAMADALLERLYGGWLH